MNLKIGDPVQFRSGVYIITKVTPIINDQPVSWTIEGKLYCYVSKYPNSYEDEPKEIVVDATKLTIFKYSLPRFTIGERVTLDGHLRDLIRASLYCTSEYKHFYILENTPGYFEDTSISR